MTSAVLRSWEFRPIIIIPILLMGVLYTIGWLRLRRLGRFHARRPHLAAWWRLPVYWLGLVLIALSLLSPIDTMAGLLFSMHMVQHLLLAMLAPPLLMAANPMPVIMWGLPGKTRRPIGAVLFNRQSAIRPIVTKITQPGIMLFVYIIFLWGWHDSSMYNAALRSDLVHDIEHTTFFITAMLLWWHITGAGPRFHKRLGYLGRAALAIAAIPATMIAGVAIAFASTPIYTFYESVPRLWGISVMTDQQLGGAIMWIPGSMMFLLAGLVLIGSWLVVEERKPHVYLDTLLQQEDKGAY
ncbi:MAG: cytochrome c oxidase assembly protein [Anaerolineae bacterium]|nr:cytochrome c oxidase assembly protein [Anaerolineae bacterium]MCO5196420.1 cytochrome c oxidase assembly protein [Anaerolineae bacterium]